MLSTGPPRQPFLVADQHGLALHLGGRRARPTSRQRRSWSRPPLRGQGSADPGSRDRGDTGVTEAGSGTGAAISRITRPGGGKRWTRRCSTMRAPPNDRTAQLAECLLRRGDSYRLREFGIGESDGAPNERSAVRSTNTWLPSVHGGAVKCGLGVKRQFARLSQAHRAVPS
jgi:hypothetical protein